MRSARAGRAGKHLDTERGRRVLAALDLVAEEQGTAVATVALACSPPGRPSPRPSRARGPSTNSRRSSRQPGRP
ncbi:hypothetical protein K8Z49_12815 [Actinomadura madurae]|uniref:hypothetical protein n=1 Tax=Actinomadura madurae TaxID=1993 RepID=UPI00399A33EC